MDELIEIMSELLAEIRELNSKIDDIKGSGIYNSINDICDKLDDVKSSIDDLKGNGVYDSISDVCDKIDSLETTITLGSNY